MSRQRDLDSTLTRLERFGVRLGLETSRRLLTGLGEPQNGYPVVLIGGTNGKGSTAALLASMTRAAGYRTGLYTSPHLEAVEERIRVDGLGISTGDLAAVVTHVVEVADGALGHPPTYFEALTAAAFKHFSDIGVDVAIFEVGLGGRLDATNASEPILSLITPIGLEHQKYLGDTLTNIAGEKAGILRPGRPAIGWLEHPEARRAVRSKAESIGAELTVGYEKAEISESQPPTLSGQSLNLQTSKQTYAIETPLLGVHQRVNLAMAVMGAETLSDIGYPQLGEEAILSGATEIHWPGRLEMVELPGGPSVLLDVAHNPDGAKALAAFLKGVGRPYTLLFGMLDDKEVAAVLPPLAEAARHIVLTAPSSNRALDPEPMRSLVPTESVEVETDSSKALRRGLDLEKRLLVACGSVYLVGEIRRELRLQFGLPQPAIDLVEVPAQLGES